MNWVLSHKEIPFAYHGVLSSDSNFTYDPATSTLTVANLSMLSSLSFIDLTVTGNTILGNAWTDTITFTGKLTGQLYCNDTWKSAQTLKIHNHLSTGTGIGSYEWKTETINTSGAFVWLWQDANINATWTATATAILWVATVSATFTATDTTLIGTYWQARVDGTVAWNSFVAWLYWLVEASTAITASHVCSAWLDSHQANAVTGSHQLLYMTNNWAAQMDEVMYIYGWDKTTAFAKFDTCSWMVSDTAETGGTSKKIKIDIDWVVHYINAYTG